MRKKILIIGNSAKDYALAKALSSTNDVYVAPGNQMMEDFAERVDIREDSVKELLEFVMENGIDMTIATSLKTLKTNIVDLFFKNNQMIFSPSDRAAKFVLDKCAAKKHLYKLRVPTPKFGIFEKQNMAADYIKNLKSPYVIKTDESSSALVLTNSQMSKPILDNLFAEQNQRVLIEDYVWGTPFSFYAITDGYKALPIGSSIVYKHSLEGDGGQLTSGMGACSPNYKLSIGQETYIMENIIYPTLEMLEAEGSSYVGILGVNGIISDDGVLNILGYQAFLEDSDATAILSNLDVNLYEIFESCTIGTFSDEIDSIPNKGLAATSLVLTCVNKNNVENIIEGLDLLNDETFVSYYPTVNKNKYLEYEAQFGSVIVLTSTASTLNKSTQKVYSEAECINFSGKRFRKDVCKPVESIR